MAAGAVQAQEVKSAGATPERHWNVVILNEGDQGLPAFMALDRAMREALTAPGRHPVDVFSESLDLLRFPRASIEDEIVALLLNQSARSHVGAIGVMQIMPATGAELKVGDITVTENNIHGGAKYMDRLMRVYFPDAKFSEGNRPLFAFASYNCGPGNVSKARKEAAKRGLDPDKWFNNVELVIAEKIGTETTTYVRNIYKYYVAYRLTLDAQAEAAKARQQVAPMKS